MIDRQRYAVLVVGAVALAACTNAANVDTFNDPVAAGSVPTPDAPNDASGGAPPNVVDVAASEQGPVGNDVAGVVEDGTNTTGSGADPAGPIELNSELSGGVVDYVDVDRNAAAQTGDADLSAEEVDSLIDSYEEFLVGADAVWMRGRDGEPDLVDSGLVDFQLARYEQSTASDLDALEDVRSFSNIERISGSADTGVVIEDCIESSLTNQLFIVSPDFVRQDVTLEQVDGVWSVTAVDVVHDGQRASLEELGCVPSIYADQAEAVTLEFVRLEAEAVAQPDVDLTALRDVTTPEFYEIVATDAASQADGVPPGSDRAVVHTLGHSPLAGPRTLYVSACRPTGDSGGGPFLAQDYEVTRGLADGFPDTGDGRDVYAVSDRLSSEQVDVCPVGSGS